MNDTMLVDCASCPVRGHRCEDCVVTLLHSISLGPPHEGPRDGGALPLDAAERAAVSLFVSAGLVQGSYAATLTARSTRGTSRDGRQVAG